MGALLGAVVSAACLALAPFAGAAPIDVFFDGPTLVDEVGDPSNFGLSFAQVQSLAGQIDVRENLIVSRLVGLAVVDQDLQSFDEDPTEPTGNRATSLWTVENTTSSIMLGDHFLLFTHSDAFTKAGRLIDYDDELIGITIDPDDGWIIAKATDETLGDFYYPAKKIIDIALGPGDTTTLRVDYVADTPLLEAPSGSERFQLHELQLGMAVVPEPSTAALLAAGLLGLAAGGRRRA